MLCIIFLNPFINCVLFWLIFSVELPAFDCIYSFWSIYDCGLFSILHGFRSNCGRSRHCFSYSFTYYLQYVYNGRSVNRACNWIINLHGSAPSFNNKRRNKSEFGIYNNFNNNSSSVLFFYNTRHNNNLPLVQKHGRVRCELRWLSNCIIPFVSGCHYDFYVFNESIRYYRKW